VPVFIKLITKQSNGYNIIAGEATNYTFVTTADLASNASYSINAGITIT
jgi:hypothetical protein